MISEPLVRDFDCRANNSEPLGFFGVKVLLFGRGHLLLFRQRLDRPFSTNFLTGITYSKAVGFDFVQFLPIVT